MKFRILFWVTIITLCSLYIIRGALTLDSDFGWHVRMGHIIREHGIPSHDPLSYSMPSYPFVDHEWLTNVGISNVFDQFGYMPLVILSAVLVFAAMLLQIPPRLQRWSLLPIILISTALFPIAGVRTQVLSWFLLSMLLVFINNYATLGFGRLLFIPLMLVWANIHGSFPTGLVVFFIFLVSRYIREHKIHRFDISLFVGAIAITFINPYGYRLWWEVWMQMTDHKLRWSIIEWMPALLFVNVSMWMQVVVAVTLMWRYWRKLDLFWVLINCFFLLAGITTYRHMALWMIASIHPTILTTELFAEEVKPILYGYRRLLIFYAILVSIAFFTAAVEMGTQFYQGRYVTEDSKYPKKAVVYLKTHLPKGEIFTLYEWGGYMNWKLPEKRVYIDGRMPSWRHSAPNKHEADYAFTEYNSVMFGGKTKFSDLQKKYNIDLVLLPKRKPLQKNAFEKWLEQFMSVFIKFERSSKPKATPFDTMKVVYSDETSLIYKAH